MLLSTAPVGQGFRQRSGDQDRVSASGSALNARRQVTVQRTLGPGTACGEVQFGTGPSNMH